MVTTRSTDKRAREDDLVLRSRHVASPSMQDSTPSRVKRRAAKEQDPQSPRYKVARIRLDAASVGDTPSQSSLSSKDLENASSIINTPKPLIAPDMKADVAANGTNIQATPMTKTRLPIAMASSSIKPEVFKTPATTKHKRFASEEPEDDTIIVNQSTDSSPQNHYLTAEEEISDSDEAPEVSIIATRSAKPHRKKSRAIGPKRSTQIDINEPGMSDLNKAGEQRIQIAGTTIVSQYSMQSLSTEDTLDVVDEQEILATIPVDPEPPKQDTQLALNTIHSPNTSSQTPAELNEESKQPYAVPKSSLIFPVMPQQAAASTTIRSPPQDSAELAFLSKQLRVPRPEFGINTNNSRARLPEKASRTLEQYRRRHTDRNGALTSTWAKKRSAFLVS